MNTQRLHQLMTGHSDGTLTPEEHVELQAQLQSDAAARQLWFLHQDIDDGLHELARSTAPSSAATRRTWFQWRPLAAAAVLVIMLGIAALWWVQRGVEVEIVRAAGGVASPWVQGDRLRMKEVKLVRGEVRLRLSSGVMLDVTAPVELQLVDAMHARVVSGKVTADVGEHGKGFVIETPQTRVEDLGTKFGVDASDAAHTDVVVFEGQVELYQKGAQERMALLGKGEALRVESHRRTSRIVSVSGADESGAWSTQGRPPEDAVITAVSDSMSATDEDAKKWPSLRNFYRIVPQGLRADALAFADSQDRWSAVPPALVGADLVRTFSVDGFNWWMEMSLTVQRPCEIFVFVDTRNEVPPWLAQEFSNTGETLTLDWRRSQEPHDLVRKLEFAVWKKTVTQPGEVKLGAPYPNPPADKKSFNPNRMFGVAAKALP